MENETRADAYSSRALSSFTCAVGLALGEILLLTGRPEELLEHLRSIHVAARATLMSSDLEAHRGVIRRPGVSLSVAALVVLHAWHEKTEDLSAVADAIALLQEVLEEMGIQYVASMPDEET
jgi:hypothetical protein